MFISPMSTHAVLWTMRPMPGSAVTSAPRRACQSFCRYWVQKDHRPLVVAQLEDLEQKAAKAVIRPAEQPFVEDEDLEGPVFPHGLRDPSRALLRILPGACLLGKRAGEIGLSRACRPKSTTSWPLVAGPQIASSPESTRSSLRSFA